tara:strand:+ start:1392 stop:2123 length:732 start_codon:yes stop_codon:yes gene_type:complete
MDGNKIVSEKYMKVMKLGLFVIGILMIFNQIQINELSSSLGGSTSGSSSVGFSVASSGSDISEVDISQVTSTAMAVATVFPELQNMKNEEDIMNFIIPTGTPEYSEALGGITFDDPVNSMEYLVKLYSSLNEEVKQNDPQTWQRYLNLAAAPRGISCEFCCGVGPQGISSDGKSKCGCKHNPAVLGLTLSLMQNTDYSDAEVLREVMKWKTMFFPKNMVGLAMQVAGTDPSQLKDLPGMVGGC